MTILNWTLLPLKLTVVQQKMQIDMDVIMTLFVCLFVLRFYGPVNPIGSCLAWSVYLTTCLLGRLSPLSD